MIKQQNSCIVIDIEVRHSSREMRIEQINDKIKVYIKEPAEKGKANLAIVRLFSKHAPCQIVSGLTSKKKKLLMKTTEEEFVKFIQNF